MTRQYLPALRGLFGEWAYYSCLMKLSEISTRVSFADQIHKSKALSQLIQRELKEGRAKDIAEYLTTNNERFFNSLVIAVYGGDPAWHALAEITPQRNDFKVEDISEDAIASLGFLSLTGDELLFALDGQHRLAGIQRALDLDPELVDDEASVIFVSHHNDANGMRRTRALFTTLNKTAKPVSKGETIALDEADVMAITVRRLVETDRRFSDKRILVAPSANLPAGDQEHLTTIVNLYDVLGILFSKVMQNKPVKELQFNRPSDDDLEAYYRFAQGYFRQLGEAVPALGTYFKARDAAAVVAQHRHDSGGNVLFRPVGMTIFAHIAEWLVKRHSLADTMKLLAKLPTDLGKAPYTGLLWNPTSGTMEARRQVLVRRILLYMLGSKSAASAPARLRADIAKVTGQAADAVKLPAKLT